MIRRVGGKNASLGEFVVQGVVTPDEWTIFKPTLKLGKKPVVGRKLGTKEVRLFDEQDEAVKEMIATAIRAAKAAGKPIGICGQAPSDYPKFARWLVRQGITSISLNPDSVIKTSLVIADAEKNEELKIETAA